MKQCGAVPVGLRHAYGRVTILAKSVSASAQDIFITYPLRELNARPRQVGAGVRAGVHSHSTVLQSAGCYLPHPPTGHLARTETNACNGATFIAAASHFEELPTPR